MPQIHWVGVLRKRGAALVYSKGNKNYITKKQKKQKTQFSYFTRNDILPVVPVVSSPRKHNTDGIRGSRTGTQGKVVFVVWPNLWWRHVQLAACGVRNRGIEFRRRGRVEGCEAGWQLQL
jgi:hypothetical protein